MAIEIVDFPINSMVDLSSSLCNKLPEGKIPLNPIQPPFSYGFPMIFPTFRLFLGFFLGLRFAVRSGGGLQPLRGHVRKVVAKLAREPWGLP